MGNERYVIKGGADGRKRLRLLSEINGPSTRRLISEIGVFDGARCLDIGCGGGDVSFELARAVGSSGDVLGVDLDDPLLELARAEASEHGFRNVSFERRDVSRWEPESEFDFVYLRFILSHLEDPASLLAAVTRHLRPGGIVAVEDIDFRGHFSEPDSPALRRSVELYTTAVRRRGADPAIGPRLPGLLRDAGLRNVKMNLWHPARIEPGGIKELVALTTHFIAEAAIADGTATADEMHNTVEQLYDLARDSHTVIGGPRMFQAWGEA